MAQVAGWAFELPEDEVRGGLGVAQPPGLRISAGGGVEMVKGGAAVVRQAVGLLLRTRPGERLMRPDYGCDLHRLFFAPNDATTAGLAIHYVRQALHRWEPRIHIARLDANRHPDLPEVLVIELEYQLRSSAEIERMSLAMNLAGG